jgi:hypothetical protein
MKAFVALKGRLAAGGHNGLVKVVWSYVPGTLRRKAHSRCT